jgi:hypothetical protein
MYCLNQKIVFSKITYFNQFKSFFKWNLSKNPCPHSPDFFTVHLSYSSLYLFHFKSYFYSGSCLQYKNKWFKYLHIAAWAPGHHPPHTPTPSPPWPPLSAVFPGHWHVTCLEEGGWGRGLLSDRSDILSNIWQTNITFADLSMHIYPYLHWENFFWSIKLA